MMTGRDLILYILQNGLEDEPVFDYKTHKFLGFMTISEAAVKFDVGVATVWVWIEQGWLSYIRLGDMIYIPANVKDPRGGND